MNAQTIEIINRVLPILLLLFLGFWLRRTHFISEEVIDGLKKIVVNIALPAVLFTSFLQVEFQPSFFVVFIVIFLMCVLLYGVGIALRPRVAPNHDYFPFLMTGFEMGMLGFSLFGSAYGMANLPFIAVIALGHEIFIWFVFLPLLLAKRDGIQRPFELLKSFFKSPVIIGILAGIVGSALGLQAALYEWPVTGGIMTTMNFLASLTIPLILIVVGYGIKLERADAGDTSRVVAIRLAILLPLALLINGIIIRGLLHLPPAYEAALFVLMIMPPPFIIPLFMRKDSSTEVRYVNNTLALYSLVSIVIFALYFVLNPTIG
ncbi:MAG: AEC family transporter [Anaerolineae bacterium]|nr:AEC family transporter [Anaerolineae bacterium]